MSRLNSIIALTLFLLSTSVLSAGNFDKPFLQQKKPSKPAYTLSLIWPVLKDYKGTKFTKIDFPLFKSDNFAIQKFHPIVSQQSICTPEICENKPFDFEKRNEINQQYLVQYVERFGLKNYANARQLWEVSGSCYKKSQTEYFNDLVTVHKKFNIVQALQANGITPSKTRIYTAEEFGKALSGLLGGKTTPTFYCSGSNEIGMDGLPKPKVLRYMNVILDESFNAVDDQSGVCNYEYCGSFIYPPVEY